MRKWALLLSLFLTSSVFAGGPQFVSDSGVGSKWNTNTAITYHVESGTCGPYSNLQMLNKLSTLFARWTSLNEVDLTVTADTDELGQVGIDNYDSYYYVNAASSSSSLLTDGINPIIFDANGSITEELFGSDAVSTVIAKASLNGFSSDFSTVQDGQILINCECLYDPLDSPCFTNGNLDTVTWDEDQLDAAIITELGRFFNLGYSQNETSTFDSTITTEYTNFPLMFPLQFNPGTDPEPRQDDVVALARLYPSSTVVEDYCLVKGVLLNSSSETLSCIDVVATTGIASQTVSQVSGTLSAGTDSNSDGDIVDDGECDTNCGYFEFYLRSGLEYSIQIQEVGAAYIDDDAIGPCVNEQLDVNITSPELATITTSQCTAGTVIDLGSLQTGLSVSAGATATGSSSGGSTGGSGTASSSGLNPATCSLKKAAPSSYIEYLILFLMSFLLLMSRQFGFKVQK